MSITLSIPVMPFKVQIRRPVDSEPTLMEQALLLWLLGREDAAFDDVAEFLSVGRRIAFDIVIGLWRRSLVVADLQKATLSLAPHAKPMVTNDNWENLGDPEAKSATVSLLVELVGGGILPDTERGAKNDPLPGAVAPVILDYDAYRSVNQSSLYWALQREPEYRRLTKGVFGGALHITPPENHAADGERLLWVDMDFTSHSFTGGEIKLTPHIADHSLRPVYSGVARSLEAWVRTHPDHAVTEIIRKRSAPAEYDERRESALQLFCREVRGLSAEDGPQKIHDRLSSMWRNVQEEFDAAESRTVSVRALGSGRDVFAALQENLCENFSQCVIVSPTLDLDRVNAIYSQLQALLDDTSAANRTVIILSGREGVAADVRARELLRQLRGDRSPARLSRNLYVSSRPANFEGSFALFDEKVLLVSSQPLLGRGADGAIGAVLTSRHPRNESARELLRYCDKAFSRPGVIRVGAINDGKEELARGGLADVATPEPLDDAAENDQVWPLVVTDWQGVAQAAESRFLAIPDHVRVLTEGEIYLEAVELLQSTRVVEDMTVAIGRLPGAGLHAQWLEALRERCRKGGRTVLRFSANYDGAGGALHELVAEFPDNIDCRQVAPFFGCYVASPRAVILAVDGVAMPLYRNLMRGTPLAFGFLLRGKSIGIAFNKLVQALLQIPAGKWWDATPEREPPTLTGASAIHRQWCLSLASDGPVAALQTLVDALKHKPHLYPILDAAQAKIGDAAFRMALVKAGALAGLGISLYAVADAYWRQGQLVETALVSAAAQEREGRSYLPPHLFGFAWAVGLGQEEKEDILLPDASSDAMEVRAYWALAAISFLRGSGGWCLGSRFLEPPVKPDFEPLSDLVQAAARRAYTYPDSTFPYGELAQFEAIRDPSSLRDAIRGHTVLIQKKKFDKPGMSRTIEKMLSTEMPIGKLIKSLSQEQWRESLPAVVDADFIDERSNAFKFARALVRRTDAHFDSGAEQFLAKMFIEILNDTFELYDCLKALGPLLERIRPEDHEVWAKAKHYLHQREKVPPPDDLAFPVEDSLWTMITDWRRAHARL
jgi:hypothetical protein